jgi:type VI secretion system ImpC/EvpB family protein
MNPVLDRQSDAVSQAAWAVPTATVAEPPAKLSLIDRVLEATRAPTAESAQRLDYFLAESSPAAAFRLWLRWTGRTIAPGERDRIARLLNRDVAQLDALINDQLNAILHHPRFQKLEAAWRGLRYLVEQKGEAENVKIRVLGVRWDELARDLERAIEFDQSQLFRKVYEDEFGRPGGEPFSVLLGDYEIRYRPSRDHPTDDVSVLTAVSQVAAAAFAPFVAGLHPALLELDNFVALQQPLNIAKTFDGLEYLKWRAFRDSEDARFVALTLPHVLMRLPYQDDGSRRDRFRFREDTGGRDAGKYLWGNAAYALGAVLIRTFKESGWLADIRGAQRGAEGGGLVPGLPVASAVTDKPGVVPTGSTDVAITDRLEPELSELGFIPLCRCQDTELSAFYGTPTVQKPKKYDDPAATANARISAMLQYMLCTSRFAHYLKVIARDKIGSFAEPEECEHFLHDWLQRYVTADAEASAEIKAKYPLRQADVRVRAHPDRPGSYLCVVQLWPHFQLDELTTSIRLATELSTKRAE